jgi:uncharacterized protein (DUF4213/DUF364 family)
MTLYNTLRHALREQISIHCLAEQSVRITCKVLSATEAIGEPEHNDYPLIRGKEVMVEAEFQGARGQAFTEAFEQATYTLEELTALPLESIRTRASFIAALNAVYRHLGLVQHTIHCKDQEPVECAHGLLDVIVPEQNVLLVGFQPRFVDILSANRQVRIVDRNPENIDKIINNVTIESPEMIDDAIGWCDLILATGSTIVNGSITQLLHRDVPVIFYGVTISAAACILNLPAYCACGR